VLGHGTHDAGYGRFLERIRANGVVGPGRRSHDGHGIGHGIAHGVTILVAPDRGDQGHAHPAAGRAKARGMNPAPCSLAGTISGIAEWCSTL